MTSEPLDRPTVLQAAFFSSPSLSLKIATTLAWPPDSWKRETEEDLEEPTQACLRRRNKECIEAQSLSTRVSAQACHKRALAITYHGHRAHCTWLEKALLDTEHGMTPSSVDPTVSILCS